jgi:hypothetical protein
MLIYVKYVNFSVDSILYSMNNSMKKIFKSTEKILIKKIAFKPSKIATFGNSLKTLDITGIERNFYFYKIFREKLDQEIFK